MRCNSYTIVNYVDDLLGLENLDISDPSFNFLLKILSQADFPISQSNLAPSSTSCVCLGLLIDTVKETISVPKEKNVGYYKWALSQKTLSKNNLQSLIGSLMFLHRNVKPTCVFPIELDACLGDLGGCWGSNIYFTQILDHIKVDNSNITHCELFNAFVALTVWGSQWKGRRLLINLDNMASVAIVNSGFTKDIKLAAIARNIWMQCALYDIEIVASHLAGVENKVADLLSRWSGLSTQWSTLYDLIPEPC